MNRSLKIYLGIFAVIVALIAILEINKSEVIDWSKNFELSKKSPFGLFVFNQEVDGLLDNKVKRTTLSPYDYFEKDSIEPKQNLLLINRAVTNQGWDKIIHRVEKGDNAFILNTGIDYYLEDSLDINSERTSWGMNDMLTLTDEKFIQDSIYIKKLAGNYGVYRIDTLTTRILGTCWDEDDDMIANFVEVKYGKGKFFLHLEPMVLTNYYMLQNDDYRYVENMFSYLPQRQTVWFQNSEEIVSSSPLRFVLDNPPLRYAWYLLLLGTLLFVIFHAKRRQRIVPVKKPNVNSSAEFVRTIGNLYLQEGSYKDMAQKKATYFLNKVRADLLIDTNKLDEKFVHKLQLKTGSKKEKIERVIPLLQKALHAHAPIQQSELLKMNKLLDEIYTS